MTDPSATTEPRPGAVEKFWELAKVHARLNPIPSYFGATALESVPPPAFTLGETPAEADAAIDAMVRDNGASLSTPRAAFADEGDLPALGALGIVLDGQGHPRLLVETSEVSIDDAVVVEQLRMVYGA